MLHPVQYLHLTWDGNTFASQIPLWVNQQQKSMQSKGQCICFRTSLCGDLSLSPIEVSTWKWEVLTEEHKVKRQSRTRENLWVHTLGPLKSSKSDSETLITASDWIGMFKGPRVCTHRFSHILPFHQLHLSVSEKTSRFQDTRFSGRQRHQKLGPPKMTYKPEHYYPNLSVLHNYQWRHKVQCTTIKIFNK